VSVKKIPNIDLIDRQIIDALVEQPELNMSQLSEKLNIPKTTVYNRYEKLKEEKIISKGIKVDKNFLYGEIVTFILIKIVSADQKIVLNKLMEFREVEEAAIITGENDMIVRLRLKTVFELNTFILEKLRKIEGIANSTSMISLAYRNKFDDI
jgi:Lrp/AsnC family transcriptional regulator for asnA, asnC and gidA